MQTSCIHVNTLCCLISLFTIYNMFHPNYRPSASASVGHVNFQPLPPSVGPGLGGPAAGFPGSLFPPVSQHSQSHSNEHPLFEFRLLALSLSGLHSQDSLSPPLSFLFTYFLYSLLHMYEMHTCTCIAHAYMLTHVKINHITHLNSNNSNAGTNLNLNQ